MKNNKRVDKKQPSRMVLLIEDDEDDYLIMHDFVRNISCVEVILEWVDRYDEALKYLAEKTPDLLLVDYNLNHIHTGIDLVREVRKNGKDIPAILVTAQEKDAIGGDEVFDVVDEYLNKCYLTNPVLEKVLCSFLLSDVEM